MNREKPYIYKRVIAYVIDLLIVTVLSGIITLVFTNSSQSDASTQKLLDLTSKMTSGEITREEYTKQFDEINYQVTKESVPVTAITCGVTIVYFVIMCYYCHGITLGKYLMKLKITSASNKELNLGNYLLRSLIINMLLTNLVSIILVCSLSKESFLSIYPKVSNIFTIIILVSFIFMMYREDGRGLHDMISGTKIVNFKKKEEETKEEITEAKIVEEKKTNRKKKSSR